MPRVAGREYRDMQPMQAAEDMKVRGYASTFEKYVLARIEGVDYYEQIDPHAFDKADMADVIMQYDHEGRVYARQSNGTLFLNVDERGLAVEADLSKTATQRGLYEDIKAGLITKMSFAFTIAEGGDDYDPKTHTRTIYAIRKVFDVSAVSIPANPGTDISARSFLDGVIEAERAERLRAEERAQQRAKLLLKLKLMER